MLLNEQRNAEIELQKQKESEQERKLYPIFNPNNLDSNKTNNQQEQNPLQEQQQQQHNQQLQQQQQHDIKEAVVKVPYVAKVVRKAKHRRFEIDLDQDDDVKQQSSQPNQLEKSSTESRKS